MANIYWSKKKIAVVGVNGNPMAKRIVEEMKAQGMKGVVELDAPKAYPDYYTLAQLEPDYVLFVYESAQCKVKITRVEGLLGDRLGHNVRRDTEESRQAQSYYKHQLKMIGIDPILLGAEETVPAAIVNQQQFPVGKGLGQNALYTLGQQRFRLIDRYDHRNSGHKPPPFVEITRGGIFTDHDAQIKWSLLHS